MTPDDPFRRAIEEEFVVERTGWAAERVQRVTERLQPDAPRDGRFETLVVWLSEHTAFTTDGRTLYISRRLLERLADDDAAAFVIGHELAHHRLGHIPHVPASWIGAARVLWIWLRRTWIKTPGRERDADLLAIELCMNAGYDPERCVAALEYLEQVALDYGDVDGVLGHEDGRQREHPPVRDRIAAVRAHAAAVRRGHRLSIEVGRRRERQRRRQLVLATAGSAALAVGLLILRRRP